MVEKAVERVLFGPEIRGKVLLVKRDGHVPVYWHLLIETEQNERKHIIQKYEKSLIISVNGLNFEGEEMPYKRGDKINIRIRGKGMILPPWSRLERDPFANLNINF